MTKTIFKQKEIATKYCIHNTNVLFVIMCVYLLLFCSKE